MTSLFKQRLAGAVALPVVVFTACAVLVHTAVFQQRTANLSLFVALDLLVSAPLLYYLAIRSTAVSRLTVLRVFMAGAFLAGLLLPARLPQPLAAIKTVSSFLAEATLIGFLFWRFYKARKGGGPHDFLWQARTVLQQVIGHKKAANLMASELAVFYYAFSFDKRAAGEGKSFTSFKENGIRLVLATFLCLFLVETAGMHLLISLWNKPVAWIMTGLSLYTCLQLFAHIRALQTRPSVFTGKHLLLRNGLLGGDVRIAIDNIEKIERVSTSVAGRDVLKLAFIAGLEKPNTAIYVQETVELEKPFGVTRSGRILLLHVDRQESFFALAEARMHER